MQIPYRKPGKYTNLVHDPIMTQDKLIEINSELAKLKAKRPAAAAQVAQLAELGDFSENAEYQLAKGRLRGINNAILRLESQITNAQVIAPPALSSTVQIGNTAKVLVNGQEKLYQILGSSEASPQKGVISYSSPLGKALLGKQVGEAFVLKTASGQTKYQVIKIG